MTVMPDQSDTSLLREFVDHGSQAAFTDLVSRHSDWVYSAAVRMVRDPDLAEDVTQAVFLVLADKAGKLTAVPLHRWLFKVTRVCGGQRQSARRGVTNMKGSLPWLPAKLISPIRTRCGEKSRRSWMIR